MDTIRILEGTKTPQRFVLLEAGEPIDLSGITVTVRVKDRTGALLSTSGLVTVSDAINGIVALTPASSGFFVASAGPYFVRWVLTLSNGQVSYCPTDLDDIWQILAK